MHPERIHLCDNGEIFGLMPGADHYLNGWFGDYMKVNKGGVIFNVSDMDLDLRLLIEPTAVIVHAVEKAKEIFNFKHNSYVLVQGCGPIGLLLLTMVRTMGVRNCLLYTSLASDDCYCELILDFLHVFPHAVKAAIKAKGPGKIVAITDACEAAGMPDGRYVLGGRAVNVVNGEARLPEGNLASSTVFMDRELNNLLSLGFSPADCVRMTSENPAALIPNCETGRLEEGCLFDAVFLDSEWKVRGTAIGGRLNMHQ